MKRSEENLVIGLLIAIGILLRFVDLALPDLSTDEAQAVLAASAAWTPLGMWIFHSVSTLFGGSMIAARMVSGVFGVATIALLYATVRTWKDHRIALLATLLAAFFPGHILFSRLAYLSVQQGFWWLATLFCFLQARKSRRNLWVIVLFFASFFATMTKVQGALLPIVLVAGLFIEQRRNAFRDLTFWTLCLSVLPFIFYFITHPGIAATLFLYTGNMYGVSGPVSRVMSLLSVWWSTLGVSVIIIVLGLFELKKLSWPFLLLLCIGTGIGFLLGAGHAYYTTHLVFWSVPAALLLEKWHPMIRRGLVGILLLWSLIVLGPTSLIQNPFTSPLYQERGFWNTFAPEINELLKDEDYVTVLGNAGHHLRWYLEPEVLVGKNMEQPYPTKKVILLGIDETKNVRGKILEIFEGVAVVEQSG